MEQVPTYLQLLQKLGVGGLFDVGVPVVLPISCGVVVHGLFQGPGNAHIVHHQAAFLVSKHPVDPCDGLHQVVTCHELVYIHGGQRGHVKPGQPHVHHNGNLHGGVVVLELPGQLLLVGLVANDLPPLLRVVVALGHHHPHLFRPAGAQLQNPVVDFHGDGAGVGHDHGLACEQIRPVILIMVQNVVHQGVHRLVRPQNGLQLAQLLFALFNHRRVGVLGQQVILGVDEPQGVLVQLQVDDPALIEHRAGGPVLHRLGHVVDVDVLPEHLPGAPVLGGDGGARKADVGGPGQAVPDEAGGAHHRAGLQGTVLPLVGHHLVRQAVLAPVGLVGHDHDVAPLGQGAVVRLKLLHGGKDDAVGLAVLQQLPQMLPAGGLLGRLAQEVPAAAELPIELVIQVVSVGDDHHCGALQGLLEQMGVKDHGQGLSAALGVPEHAALAVGLGGVLGGGNGLAHGEILVIPRQDFKGLFPVQVKADEVFQDVQKPLFLKDTLKKGVKLGRLGVLIAAVLGFPRHEAVLAGGDGARLGGVHIADDTHLVVHK